MKHWKDGNRRYELNIANKEAGILYFDERVGYYFRIYIGGSSYEKILEATTLINAKNEAEIWLAEKYRQQIELHKQAIDNYQAGLIILTADC